MTDHTTIAAVVKRALMREAEQNLAAGQRLLDGRWINNGDHHAALQAMRRRNLREAVEAVVFWALTALIGLGFMAVVVAIL